jgi:DNA-binding GntR family transcriptional regulator
MTGDVVADRNGGRAGSLTENVYEQLRGAIVRGELRPNQRVIELEVAERLQVSRTPVRETLQRLALEGLVASHRRGWIVREHSSQEIHEIYQCRTALESYAARLAAEHAAAEEVEALAEILGRGAPDPRPLREWMASVNEAFHDGIISAARNPMLADLCRRSRRYYFNHRIAALYTPEEAAESRRQHLAILEAIRAHDPEAAEHRSRDHIATALRVLLQKLA